MKFLAAYIMRGRWQAMMVASSLALLSLIMPPVSIVSSATVALVTLRKGTTEGLYVLLSACVAAALLGALVLGSYQFALGYGAILWIPVWLISIVLREGRHLSLALEIAVILGALAVIGYYLYNPEPAQMWRHVLQQIVQPMLEMPDAPVEKIQKSLDIAVHYMTGIIAAGSVSGLLLGLLLGRWWQSRLYNPGGFKLEYLSLKTQPLVAIGGIIILAIALVANGIISEIAWNITILSFVLYTFIGTAVLHVILSAAKAKWFLLPTFYLLLFMMPHILLPVAFIGLGDTWMNLRNKFSNQTGA